MITKTITSHSIKTLDYSNDISTLRRLLIAAAISSRFCEMLLENPGSAVRSGFGGEVFSLSDSTLTTISSIRASTLGDFIQQMNEVFPIL